MDIGILVATGALALAGDTPVFPSLAVELKQDTTVIATRRVTPTASFAEYSLGLTAGERASITNYAALRYSFTAGGRQIVVSWADLNAPASVDATVAPSVGAMAVGELTPSLSAASSPQSASPPAGALALDATTPVVPTMVARLEWSSLGIPPWSTAAEREVHLTSSFTSYDFALTAGERAAITSYGYFRLLLIADGKQASVSWAEVEFPADLGPLTVSPGAGELALAGETIITPYTVSPGTGAMVLARAADVYTKVRLYQDTTLIAERRLGQNADIETESFDLTTEEVALITDWTDLEIELVCDVTQNSVSWLALETPDRGVYPAAGSLAFAGVAPLPSQAGQGAPSAEAMAFSGTTPTVTLAHLRYPAVATLALDGALPVLAAGPVPTVIPVGLGEMDMAGEAGTAFQPVSNPVPADALAFAGAAPTMVRDHIVTPTAGSMAFDGILPTAYIWSVLAPVEVPNTGDLEMIGTVPSITQAPVGPVALFWGGEYLTVAGCASATLVSARITGETLEYVT